MEQTPDIDCSCGHTACEGNMRSTAPATLEASNPTQHQRSKKAIQLAFALLTLMASVILTGCHASTASPEVSGDIRKSLDEAGLKDVSVSQDRAKGIVTLGGHVTRENDKAQAESLARSYAGSQVVADQIAVIPAGIEKEAKAMNADLDQGIEKNLDAALIQSKMHENVKYGVKSGVVTLTGDVNSQNKRDQAERVALRVPNVKQVVNDLQVKDQKASSLL
jgi:hyperosmotically inducible protein